MTHIDAATEARFWAKAGKFIVWVGGEFDWAYDDLNRFSDAEGNPIVPARTGADNG